MDPFEAMRTFGDLWGKGSEAFLKAQSDAFGAVAKASGDAARFPSAGPDLEALEKARRAFEQSWATASEISARMSKSGVGPGEPDGKGGEILAKIFDPKGWFEAVGGIDESMTQALEGPRLADLWNVERKFAAVYSAWLTLRRRSLEHHTLMLEIWTQAAGRFAQDLNGRAEKGETLASWRDAMPLWIETANDVLVEAQRSEAFLSSQREVLTASTDLKLAQQEVAAFYSETFGYPSRAELDDVHKALTELRREVRGLKRARRKPASEGAGT